MDHLSRIRIVEFIFNANTVFLNVMLFFDKPVGWQTAIAFFDTHYHASGEEAQTNLFGTLNRIIQLCAVGIKIKMIRAHRAP